MKELTVGIMKYCEMMKQSSGKINGTSGGVAF